MGPEGPAGPTGPEGPPGGGGTPGDTVVTETSFGQSSAAGSQTDYSRKDHTHGTPGDPVPTHAALTTGIHGAGASTLATAATLATAVSDHNGLAGPHAGATSVGGKAIPGAGFEPAGTAASAVSTHAGEPDPHAGYQKESEKGAANGYASLGAGGLVPMAQLASGTPTGSKYIRDDGTLQVPAGGSGLTQPQVLARVAMRF